LRILIMTGSVVMKLLMSMESLPSWTADFSKASQNFVSVFFFFFFAFVF
jgi:hypothetical protein